VTGIGVSVDNESRGQHRSACALELTNVLGTPQSDATYGLLGMGWQGSIPLRNDVHPSALLTVGKRPE